MMANWFSRIFPTVILLQFLPLYRANSVPPVRVNPVTHGFKDRNGREVFFHGVNAVFKVAPWAPVTVGMDSENTLSLEDAKNLKEWGFNIVRLGVMWPGVEPSRGSYNTTYLDVIETIVKNLASEGVYVLLDFHQDLLHRQFCGEGVPDYVHDICVSAEPTGTQSFPKPVVDTTYPQDENGNPDINSCLSQTFAKYYLSAEVSAAFQCLYDNIDGLWTNFGQYWQTVANRFKIYDNVIGYDLINEPWAGNPYTNGKVLLPGYAEKNFLEPLYKSLHNAIRTVDNQKIIFFEGLTIDYWPYGFTEGPGGPEYNDRQAISYHIYCPIYNGSFVKELVCDGINDEFLTMRRRDAERLGVGMMMTEFGASRDVLGDLYALKRNCDQADKYTQSWIYWQFKYYEDLTTVTPQGESLYDADGTVNKHKIEVLSRAYPQAVSGSNISFSFDQFTGAFKLSYVPIVLSTDDNGVGTSPTVIYYGTSYGAKVDVSSDSLRVVCGGSLNKGLVYIYSEGGMGSGALPVTVTVSRCHSMDIHCTCRL